MGLYWDTNNSLISKSPSKRGKVPAMTMTMEMARTVKVVQVLLVAALERRMLEKDPPIPIRVQIQLLLLVVRI
jgi:hypothetical protein